MALPFFSYRSVTTLAYSALSDAAPTMYQRGAVPIGITDAVAGASSAIGGKVLNLGGGAAANAYNLTWTGYTNLAPLSGVQKISILWRGAFGVTSAGNLCMSALGGGPSGYFPNLFGFATNAGDTRVQVNGATGAAVYNSTGFGWSGNAAGLTRGVMYDVLVSYNGATTTSNLKWWLDGTLVATTSAGALPAWDITRFYQICLGGGLNGITDTCSYVNEMCIWAEEIDAGAVTLTGLTGATLLSGITRTEFVAATYFDGHRSVDPGITRVLSGASYAINGVSFVGTGASLPQGNTINSIAGGIVLGSS